MRLDVMINIMRADDGAWFGVVMFTDGTTSSTDHYPERRHVWAAVETMIVLRGDG